MHMKTSLLASALFLALTACATDDQPQESNDVSEVSNTKIDAPDGCESLVAIARPIAAPHFHDPKLQQTAGKLTLRFGDGDVRTGTSLATIVGLDAAGAPL